MPTSLIMIDLPVTFLEKCIFLKYCMMKLLHTLIMHYFELFYSFYWYTGMHQQHHILLIHHFSILFTVCYLKSNCTNTKGQQSPIYVQKMSKRPNRCFPVWKQHRWMMKTYKTFWMICTRNAAFNVEFHCFVNFVYQ